MKRPVLVVLTAGTLVLVPVAASAASSAQVSPGGSPFAGAGPQGAPCNGVDPALQTGLNQPGTEVEPQVAVNPANPSNVIATWQQDRWTNGGSNATMLAYSNDGGRTWIYPVQPPFVRCWGGNAANGGDYERASDPWVSFSADGTAYYQALPFNQVQDFANAVVVSRSTDGGRTWSAPTVLRRDTAPAPFNDKNSITGDPTAAHGTYAYAVWDRLVSPSEDAGVNAVFNTAAFRGPIWFTRTTDSGSTWEPARQIFDPGQQSQTIGNVIVVARDGTLVDGFDLINDRRNNDKRRGLNVAVLRSPDQGTTWDTTPTIVDSIQAVGAYDPTTLVPLRSGDGLPSFAADPSSSSVYAVWQDARSTGGTRDQVAIARSDDNGRTWRTLSYAINKDTATQAFTPIVAVGADGTVAVLYYDFRTDTSGPSLPTSTWLLTSKDKGLTWTETSVAPAFDLTGGAHTSAYFLGDYMGLAAQGNGFVALYPKADGPGAVPPAPFSTAPSTDIFATTLP